MEEERGNGETWLGKHGVELWKGQVQKRGGKALPEMSWDRTLTACAQPHAMRACLMLDSSWSSVCFL